ncbi:MAG: hypothetical protein HQM03_19720 [Magnetococcales bacterium]|nr:hypothetical protein [Magnetococcales bacterium]
MISVTYPVMLQLYRRVERTRPARQVVEPGSGVEGRTAAYRPGMSQRQAADGEGNNDFQAFFKKALEQQE